MKLHAAAVVLVVLVSSYASAQTSDKPMLSSVTLNSSTNLIGEVRSENPVNIVVFDLTTGEEKTIKKTDIKGRTTATDTQAISRVGLPRFLAWRIAKAMNGPPTGKIAEVTPASVYLTLGEKDGIEVGKTVSVFREEGDLKDPDTGNVIGKKRSKLATLEVTEVKDSYSKAKVLGELEVELKAGDLVEQDGINQSVAILPILDLNGEETTPGKSLVEQITTVVVSRGISVVDRQRLDDTLNELALHQSKVFDQATAQKVGRHLGAVWILTGTIAPKGNRAEAHVRLIRVETGEITVAGVQDVGPATVTTTSSRPVVAKGNKKPVAFQFLNQADIEKSWSLVGSEWTLQNGGVTFKRGSAILSKQQYVGDFSIQVAFSGIIKVNVCGESFVIRGTSASIQRIGDTLTFRSSDGASSGTLTIKESARDVSTAIRFGYNDGTSNPGGSIGAIQIVGTVEGQ